MTKDLRHESDSEMEALFASLDHVSASDSLKNKTLQAILDLSNEEECGTEIASSDTPQTSDEKSEVTAVGESGTDATQPVQASSEDETHKEVKVSRKSRWRIIRTTAIAACLALACFGGLAYATPAANVRVETDNGTVELQVNRFGRTISAHAETESAQSMVDEASPGNKSYEESIDSLLDALGDPADHEATIDVESSDDKMREGMQERGARALEDRGFGQPKPEDAPDAQPAADFAVPQTDVMAPDGADAAPEQTEEPGHPQEQGPAPTETEGQTAPAEPGMRPELSGSPDESGQAMEPAPGQDGTVPQNEPSRPGEITEGFDGQAPPAGDIQQGSPGQPVGMQPQA